MVRVNLHDRIERQMWGGCYEPHVRHALHVLLSPGDTFIDVGGHIGYHTVPGASLVGSQGRVVAFEADPRNFARLRDHLGPFPWATAVNRAVWSSTGTVIFERSSEPGESGWGTLITVRDLQRGEHITVDTISLDDWLSENINRCVSAINVDAEGSEVSIFQGATEVLKRIRPTVIFEANDVVLRQAHTSALALTEIFYGHGYDLFEFDRETMTQLSQGDAPQSSELLALPKERTQATITRFERSGFRVENFRIRNREIK